jgi:hypothetical protein
MDYPGKVITKNQVTPTQTSATGVWTLDDAAAATRNNNWPVAGVPNPISKSLRFNSADSAYLNRTFSTPTLGTKWSWNGWVKRSALGSAQTLFSGQSDVNNWGYIQFLSGDTLSFAQADAGSVTSTVTTTQVFRDASSWYCITVVFDSTQATAADRLKMYVNGSQITAFGTATYLSQNTASRINQATAHQLGRYISAANYLSGYMTEINFIDGQALTPSSFGMTDPVTGVWEPLKYSGTYGTNGFYLNFKDATSTTTLGYDYSGNANNWTANGFVVSPVTSSGNDSVTDVPTPWVAYNATGDVGGVVRGNYATLNPLITGNVISPSNGNLDVVLAAGSNAYFSSVGTIAIPSGKWYWECVITARDASAGQWFQFGIVSSTTTYTNNAIGYSGNMSAAYAYYNDGSKAGNGTATVSYGATFTTNDVIGVAFDDDAGTITFYKNGVSQGQAFSGISTSLSWYPIIQIYRSAGTNQSATINFGQRQFTHTPPSGFRSLCTTNLPASTILKGSEYMNAVLYSGNSGSQSITGVGFQPDLVWGKSRNIAENNALFDSVRGVNKALYSNLTVAEATDPGVSAFNSDGFSLNGPTINATGYTYVAWNWKANGAGSSNTAGSITSTVSANTTSGFSIATFTDPNNSSNYTVGHGCQVNGAATTPSMIIVKERGTSGNWIVWHSSATTTVNQYLLLNDTAGTGTLTNVWGAAVPTATVFGLRSGTSVSLGDTVVAYCFAPVPGYSAFGSYTGNGATVGPFVYTGFRPRFVLTKGTATSNWAIIDTSISPYNVAPNLLIPNTNGAVLAFSSLDILSNGFQIRNTDSAFNANGNTYIYACFAENPFKNALAR